MKIYFENKCIRLEDHLPGNPADDETFVEFSSPEQAEKEYQEFEKSGEKNVLCLWTPKDYDQLIKDFFSLFKFIKAAGGLVKNEKNELLVIFRNDRWDLPKGKLSTTRPTGHIRGVQEKRTLEMPGNAAIREVMEETGLRHVRIVSELPSTYHIYYRKEKRYLKRTCWFVMTATSDQQLIPETAEDISIAKWISRNELQPIIENTYPSLKELFSLAFRR